MTKETAIKGFDCIKFTREARARIAEETAGMTNEERLQRLRQLTDPWFAKMTKQMHGPNSASQARNKDNTEDAS